MESFGGKNWIESLYFQHAVKIKRPNNDRANNKTMFRNLLKGDSFP